MLSTNVMPWLRTRRLVVLVAAAALAASMALAAIGNSWTASANPEGPTEVVADDDMTVAGPSWTYSARIPYPPVDFFGPSWG